uniref:Uncharacterized protein n=1 Tax=viral metagenome TaxID=1070528 RepID=A0A6M3M3H4_9ZZZZ
METENEKQSPVEVAAFAVLENLHYIVENKKMLAADIKKICAVKRLMREIMEYEHE